MLVKFVHPATGKGPLADGRGRIRSDIRTGDRVKWDRTDNRGTVVTVSNGRIIVEWEDGSRRAYDGPDERRLHRVYVPQA
jgi:hypothetical protein